MKSLLVSESENLLVETIRDVRYGELYDVLIAEGPRKIKRHLRDGNVELIKFLRKAGYIEVPLIQIHDGEVKQVEVTGNKNRIKYRQKIRF